MLGPVVKFDVTGPQTLRIQTREDGFRIDQIVLSAGTYLTSSPGRAEERRHDPSLTGHGSLRRFALVRAEQELRQQLE